MQINRFAYLINRFRVNLTGTEICQDIDRIYFLWYDAPFSGKVSNCKK